VRIAPPAVPGDRVADVDTPALLLDLDAFEANIARLHDEVLPTGIAIRPHGKAHKCPEIARRQTAAGAVGICAQSLGEAEVFVRAGIADVLLSNEIAGADKAARLAALAGTARVAVCVDLPEQVAQLAAATAAEGTTLGVLVEVATGRRCGVSGVAEALRLADEIGAAPGLELRGLQVYAGSAQHFRKPSDRAAAIERARAAAAPIRDALGVRHVTGGGTGTYPLEMASGLWTEIQPGSYVLMDADYALNDEPPPFRQAISVLARVITTHRDRVVVDAGHKAIAVDSGDPTPPAGLLVFELSDEHTILLVDEGESPAYGSTVQLIPGHCDPTVNLHDWIVATRGQVVEDVWLVEARGA
jgi:D-serine deaminase-like pyridoxal phosphate-dependent protein